MVVGSAAFAGGGPGARDVGDDFFAGVVDEGVGDEFAEEDEEDEEECDGDGAEKDSRAEAVPASDAFACAPTRFTCCASSPFSPCTCS